MISHRPPSTTRAVWIVGRLALRRQINRWQGVRFGRKTRDSEAQRSGTATKSGRRSIFGLCLFLLTIFSGFIVASSGIVRISALAQNLPQSPGKFVVSAFAYARLIETEKALQDLKRLDDPAERRKYEGMWNRHLEQLFIFEVRRGAFTEDEENVRLSQMRERFSAKGVSGFIGARADLFVTAATAPPGPQARTVFFRSLSLLFALWIPMIVFLALGINNKDLGQVEWSFEWLYTFPVSARALFVSKVLVYSFLDQMVCWLLFPFAVLVYIAGGYGYAAIPFGLAATLYLAIPAGSISTVVEVALRKFLSLDRLKNAQALFTVLGTACLLIFYASMFSPAIAAALVHRAASMADLMNWNPFFLPLMVGNLRGQWQRQLLVLGMIGATCAAVFFAVSVSEWLTRDGLIKAGGPYQGGRSPAQGRIHDTWLRGIGAQEMLLLRRDRNLLVQVLVVPLLVPAYYLLIDPHLRSALTGNFRRAAMVAFLVGAYSFVSSAMPLLSREDKTLWLLLSFPRSLVSMLLSKAMFWAVVGVLYGATVLVLLVHFSVHLHVTSWGYVFLAFYGIALYAFIASGVGVLATNVLETERRAQMRVGMVYLYFVLTAMYANIFLSAALWTSLAQLVLTTLLAVALWQKVKDIAPYLLDPTQWPPRTISLADGMIAALGFFVAQPLALMLLQHTSKISLTAQITVAYMIAGLVVGGAVLGTLWLQQVPDLWKEIGFIPPGDDGRRLPAARGLVQGAIWGGAAALGAFVYLHALGWFSQWKVWKQDAELSSFLTRADQPLWICVLLVVAAPVLEEFLFRGLVFQGLRRSTGPLLAVLGSAALFALVHPPIAVIPVFGLGIAAAVSFNRSRFLLAPILTHAVYNGCVLFFNRL